MPMVFHCSAENEVADGVLWHRWQFSAHNSTPLFAAIFLLSTHPLEEINAAMQQQAISAVMTYFDPNIFFIKSVLETRNDSFRILLKIEG
jgi:hypothetical protein